MRNAVLGAYAFCERLSHSPVALGLAGFACLQHPVAAVPPDDLYGRSVAYLAMADAFGLLALAYAERYGRG